jgi:hypothetical protein
MGLPVASSVFLGAAAMLRRPSLCRLVPSAVLGCALLLPMAAGCEAASEPKYEPRVGDLVFQSSPRGPLVDAIEGATDSPYSHVGMVVERNNQWFVLEAGGGGVGITPLDTFILRGRGGKFSIFRFQDKYAGQIPQIVAEAERFRGKPYDIRYEFDDAKIYCSELIFKGFKAATGEELGRIRKLGDLNWQPYEAVIRQIESGGLPLERPMITPRDLSEAEQLTLVMKHGF